MIISCALILQEKKRIFIAVDSAISCSYNNKNYRLYDEGLKHLIINNKHFIFATGEVEIIDKIFNEIKKLKNITPLGISFIAQKYNKKYKNKKFEIIYLKTSLTNVKLYQIYKENNFKPLIHNIIDNLIKISSVGFLTKKIITQARKYISENKDVVNLMLNSFEDINCNEVGGLISVYSITDKIELLNKTKLSNEGIEYLVNNNKHYIYANSLYSEIIVSSNLTIRTEDNSTTIDENGITVTRNDDKFRTILNATDGILMQTTTIAGDWSSPTNVFEVDTNGIVYARDFRIIDGGGNDLLDSDTGTFQDGFINGSVITGGIVRTSDTYPRVEINSTGNQIIVYDSGANKRISINESNNNDIIVYDGLGLEIPIGTISTNGASDDFAINAVNEFYLSASETTGVNIFANNRRIVTTSNSNQDIRLQVSGGRLEYYNGSTWTALANLSDVP